MSRSPATRWRGLSDMPAEASRAAAGAVRERCSTERSFERLLELIAGAQARMPDPARLVVAIAEQAAGLADELDAVRDVGDRLWIELEAQRRRSASTVPTVSP